MSRNKTVRNSFLLFLTACIWGMAFVSQSKGMESMGPFTFNGIRSLLGAAVVFPVVLVRRNTVKKEAEKAGKDYRKPELKTTLLAGLLCGIFFTSASMSQQIGMQYTTVGKAGFITAFYIILVPILGVFLKKKIPWIVWPGAAIACFGMYLLCMTEESLRISWGDGLIFLCAVLFAGHILTVDTFADKTEGVMISFMQLLFCGVVCTTIALFLEHPTFGQIEEGLGAILYAGILSCGVAYTLQIIGQKGVNPMVASLIMSLESVVSAVAGVAAFKIGLLKMDQTMTARQVIGCVLVFAAVILVQLPIPEKGRKQADKK